MVLLDVVKNGLQQYRFERILPANLALYAAIFAYKPSLARSLVSTNINAIEAALRTQFNKFIRVTGIAGAFDAEAEEALKELSRLARTDGQADKIRPAPSSRDADLTGLPRVRSAKSETGETQTFTVNQPPKRVIGARQFQTMRPTAVRITPVVETPQPPVIDPTSPQRRGSVQLSAVTPRARNGSSLAPLVSQSPSVSPPPTPRLDNPQKLQLTTLKAAASVATAVRRIEDGIKKDQQPKKPTPPPIDLNARRKSLAALALKGVVSGAKKA